MSEEKDRIEKKGINYAPYQPKRSNARKTPNAQGGTEQPQSKPAKKD